MGTKVIQRYLSLFLRQPKGKKRKEKERSPPPAPSPNLNPNCSVKPQLFGHKQLQTTTHTVPSNEYCANVMHVLIILCMHNTNKSMM